MPYRHVIVRLFILTSTPLQCKPSVPFYRLLLQDALPDSEASWADYILYHRRYRFTTYALPLTTTLLVTLTVWLRLQTASQLHSSLIFRNYLIGSLRTSSAVTMYLSRYSRFSN
nr:MAG TPA: hypothetical protein [Caudoviricetes sp.]